MITVDFPLKLCYNGLVNKVRNVHHSLTSKQMSKLSIKQRKFVKNEKVRLVTGEGSRAESFKKAGYASKHARQNAYHLEKDIPAIRKELDKFSDYLLELAPPEKVAETLAEDIFQEEDKRTRLQARAQWLKAMGVEGASTIKFDKSISKLAELFDQGDKEDKE